MIDALHISETGLKSTQTWLDYLSNNIANMHTPGYKKTQVNFQDMVATPSQTKTTNEFTQIQKFSGLGAKISSPIVDFSNGALKATGKPLDIAIKGRGLLEVVLNNGDFAYTRLGNLEINSEGLLATNGGLPLSDRIQIPNDVKKLEIKKDGTVIGTFANDNLAVELGRIQLAEIVNPNAFSPLGESLYKIDGETEILLRLPGEDGTGEIQQGFLEMSNVNLVDEMTSLVLAQRAYQLNARLIQTADQILETINNLRR